MSHDEIERHRQAKATLDAIIEMVDKLNAAREEQDEEAIDEALAEIHEDPLSIEVNDGWRVLGEQREEYAEEYRILLTTGGPAFQITGQLNEGEPTTAKLEGQDWFIPWYNIGLTDSDREKLLEYVRCFCFYE